LTGAHSDPNRWWALIGPPPSPTPLGVIVAPHDKSRRLAGSLALGPIALRDGEHRFVQYTRAEPRSLDGWTEHESWPIVVEGSSQVDSGLEFDHEAAMHVRRAAMLVSLAWRESWHVRSQPKLVKNLPPSVPDSDPLPLPFVAKRVEVDPAPTPLPEWLTSAWGQLEGDEWIARALLLWHEGFLVEPSHPSLGLLAYTAAVEAVSKSSWAATRNPHVASRPTARFESTIRLVADDPGSADVLQQLGWYRRRSETVHEGTLHGHELPAGPLLDYGTSIGAQPRGDFAVRIVPTARSLAARLIELSLQEPRSHG
jgi:hypothetical protein